MAHPRARGLLTGSCPLRVALQVQQTDTLEELEAVLDKHIARLQERREARETPAEKQHAAAPEQALPPPLPPTITIPAQPPAATPTGGQVQPPSPMCSISASILSSDHGDERHAQSSEESAKRRAAERQQEWCRYSLMLASAEDGAAVGNATIRAMCENLRQRSPVIVKRTLDELEVHLSARHERLDPEVTRSHARFVCGMLSANLVFRGRLRTCAPACVQERRWWKGGGRRQREGEGCGREEVEGSVREKVVQGRR